MFHNLSILQEYVLNFCDSIRMGTRLQSMVHHRIYPLFIFDLTLDLFKTMHSIIYIMSHMHLQSLKLLCPTAKKEINLQENTLFDPKVKVT